MVAIEKKTLAVVIAIVLLSTGVIVANEFVHFENDREIDIISRVNEEGSMLFLRNSEEPSDYCTINGGTLTISSDQRNNWNGLVVGTPGITTIQHKMLEQFVKAPYAETYVINETGLGMDFQPYRSGMELNDGVVYYDPSLTNKAQWDSPMTSFMRAGIIWEPVCSAIVLDGSGKELIDTSILSPGHACCVIAGSHQYLTTHEQTTVQFLRGYIEAVNEINYIIENKDVETEKYAKFVSFVAKYTQNTEETVELALTKVKYTYGNDGPDDRDNFPLTNLKYEIEQFIKLSGLTDKVRNMGYNGNHPELDYANTIVNDKYLRLALDEDYIFTEREIQINVAAIKGDVHQIALQFGMEMGFFAEHRVAITIFQAPNGAGVATSLQNGAANIGFMGVPPITLVTINSALNPAKMFDLSGTIVDSSGNPVANAEVTITTFGETYECKTDSNGHFTVKVYSGTYAYSSIAIIKVNTGGSIIEADFDELLRIDSNTDLGKIQLEDEAII